MPTTSGYTTFGIIRKRMADLYADFAQRIKEGGVFGTQTTADAPDIFPTDPLVQIMTVTSASTAELWEAVEKWYQQLNLETAEGVYLEFVHGRRAGILRDIGQTDDSYRAAIRGALASPARSTITTVATSLASIECAALVVSSVENPIPDVPAPGNALVIKGCNPDYDELAQALYDSVELGLHQFYGDIVASVRPPDGGCVTYRFIKAEPLFIALEIVGYFTTTCGESIVDDIVTASTARLTAAFSGNACALGGNFNSALAATLLSGLPEFVVTEVRVARRARQLFPIDCDFTGVAVDVCGVVTPWATATTCGTGAGEVWCEPVVGCVSLLPWEYVAFDTQFITVTEDPTQGGCA